MTYKNPLFAFVTGEVSEEFYGRRDLARHALALKLAENFIIDYRGGLLNRAGYVFTMEVSAGPHRIVPFRTTAGDLELYFTPNKMRVLQYGKPVLAEGAQTGTVGSGGAISPATPSAYAVGDWVELTGVVNGFYEIAEVWGTGFRTLCPIVGGVTGAVTIRKALTVAHSLGAYLLPRAKFHQDLNRLVAATAAAMPYQFERDPLTGGWTVTAITTLSANGPATLNGTASGSGTASCSYVVTAVVNDVESAPSPARTINNMVNMTTTTGSVSLTWSAVAGASHYNVYRTVVAPTSPFAEGQPYFYLGRATGLTLVDANITTDGTKSPPEFKQYFADGNYPGLYCRFQQRGIYAALAKAPLRVVGSNSRQNRLFTTSAPPIATDSFEYDIDATSPAPIKHMLPLRYGLLVFTDDGVTQLKGGGESYALTATSALAEHQGAISISDVTPAAINLDVVFVSELFTEINAMLYTEYTNSFKMQDLLALSAHMFGPDLPVLDMQWLAEPHKIVKFLRGDGQLVTLTYARNDEVFGWARSRTKGRFKSMCATRQLGHCLSTVVVERQINGRTVRYLEREAPRFTKGFHRMVYTDATFARKIPYGEFDLTITKISERTPAEAELWAIPPALSTIILPGHRLSTPHGLFEAVSHGGVTRLVALTEIAVSGFYDKNHLTTPAGEWAYGQPVDTVGGLHHLEGELVSVMADGNTWLDQRVTNGQVSFDGKGLVVMVGLGYRADAETLPLSLANEALEGHKLTLRGVALRQVNTVGLKVGRSEDTLRDITGRSTEAWGAPLQSKSELKLKNLGFSGGWAHEVTLMFRQDYPLPCGVVGLTYELDVGE